jgi:hypothetical protein
MVNFPRMAACLLALAAPIVVGTESRAQVSCYGPSDQLPAEDVGNFQQHPEQLLSQYPDGGAELISRIRDLVATSPAALQTILKLVETANATQIDAIGTGLGQAALACVRTYQHFAIEIQQAVAALDNGALQLAFEAVLGDKAIGSAGGGGGGGGGPTSPLFGSVGGFGGSSTLLSFGTTNHEPNFFTLSNTSGSTPGTPNSGSSVSPSR